MYPDENCNVSEMTWNFIMKFSKIILKTWVLQMYNFMEFC